MLERGAHLPSGWGSQGVPSAWVNGRLLGAQASSMNTAQSHSWTLALGSGEETEAGVRGVAE